MNQGKSSRISGARRHFLLRSTAMGAAWMLPRAVHAGRLHRVEGDVTVNGKQAYPKSQVRALDVVATGANGKVILVAGRDAFLIRADSEVEILGTPKALVLTGLRMVTGGLLGVFGKGPRQLLTSTATIGIRGTGIYMEASAEQTYFCTCYGEVEIRDVHRTEQRLVISGYHVPTMIYAEMTDGAMMQKTAVKNHTDDELVMLEKLVGRIPPFVSR